MTLNVAHASALNGRGSAGAAQGRRAAVAAWNSPIHMRKLT